jgi:hypothetical protein
MKEIGSAGNAMVEPLSKIIETRFGCDLDALLEKIGDLDALVEEAQVFASL